MLRSRVRTSLLTGTRDGSIPREDLAYFQLHGANFDAASRIDRIGERRNTHEALNGPSDLVALAAIERTAYQMAYAHSEDSQAAVIRDTAWSCAVAAADAEGLIWTPRLDAMGFTWLKSMRKHGSWNGSGDQPGYHVAADWERRIASRLEPLRDMFISEGLEASQEALTGFDCPVLWGLLGSTLSQVTEEDLARSTAEHTGVLLETLARHPATSEESLGRVLLRIVGVMAPAVDSFRIHQGPARCFAIIADVMRERFGGMAPDVAGMFLSPRHQSAAFMHREAVMRLAATHPRAEREILREIAAGTDDLARASALVHPVMAGDWKKDLDPSKRRIPFADLLEHPALTPEIALHLARIVLAAPYKSSPLASLIACPLVPDEEAIRLALCDLSNAEVRVALARRPAAFADPRTRADLLRSSAQGVITAGVRYARDQEVFEKYLRRLFATSPRGAFDILADMEISSTISLPQDIVLAAASSTDTALRSAATAVALRWRQAGSYRPDLAKPLTAPARVRRPRL